MDFGGLKVLMVSSDRRIFDKNSAVLMRMKEYAGLVEELHIVVLATKSHSLKETQIAPNAWAYPANAPTRWLYPNYASSLGKKIVLDKKFVRGRAIVTSQDPFECGVVALRIAHKWKLPLEVQMHTDPFSPGFSGALNSVRKKLAKKVLSGASRVRVVSESLKTNIAEHFEIPESRLYVLPIYIDQERIKNSTAKFDLRAKYGWKFTFLSVARLEPEKNLSLAIKVLSEVRKSFPSTGLVLVGSGTEEKRLKDLAKDLRVSDCVKFEGWQEDLASYYKSASVYIQTSVFEGYGMSLVEAGLSGLPVISTAVGVALEFEGGKDLYLCKQDDVGCFAGSVIDLIQNNHKRENLKTNMRHILEKKLITKEEYMEKLQNSWNSTSKLVG